MLAFRSRWLTILAALLTITASSQASMAPPITETVRIQGEVLPALAGARRLASRHGESNEQLTLTIVLKHDDQAGVDRYIRELNDPHSKNFHKYLTQEQIANRFGPSRGAYRETLRFLHDKGFKLVAGSKNRLTITVRGTRAQAESAFGIAIGDYQIGSRKFYANDSDPALPRDLAAHILSVGGLTNYAEPQPTRQALILAACVTIVGWLFGGLLGADPNTPQGKACILDALAECVNSNFAAAGYGTPIVANFPCCDLVPGVSICPTSMSLSPSDPASLFSAAQQSSPALNPPPASIVPLYGANGTGQTVGLIEFDNFNTSDVSNYLNLIGQPASNISNLSSVAVDGGATIGAGEDEVLLDIDTVMSIAPGAKVVVYDAPFTGPGSFQSVFNAAISGGASIISNSWAYCEDQTTSADAEAIDTIFQNAGMAHVSVFNGSGDSGSTCLDGSANTVAVPADSPNATAVGGSSLTPGPGYTYGSETWWDDSKTTPVAGQGGFGVSKFFASEAYQQILTGSAMRTVPDVVANADPFHGSEICQADNGGCPSGKQYGGTSMSAPEWAGFTALLNQVTGQTLGFANPKLYSLANTAAFHGATALGSDVLHVGLGSPDLNALYSMLSGQAAGAVDPAVSEVIEVLQNPIQPPGSAYPTGEPNDGSSAALVRVMLSDSNGIAVSGKTVTLSAGASSAKITPASVMSNADGIATFQVTDKTAENLTLTATDMTDSMALKTQPGLPFLTAPAASAQLDAFPGTVPADDKTAADITVTLKDGLGRPAPGKFIQINQTGGASVISGPNPPVTDGTGTIQFTAIDSNNETITYSAVDVTDGNLPFPQTGTVTFSDSPAAGCSNAQVAAPGFIAQPYVTGLAGQSFTFGDVNFTCAGPYGMAWDADGNLFASDGFNGNLYKIPPGGGVAGAGTLVANVAETISGLAIDKSGNLYASIETTPAGFTTGSVVQLDPSTGAIIKTLASNLTCPAPVAIDPLSGDLFTDDSCSGAGSDNASLWRISNPSGPDPTLSVYATLPNTPNANIGFATDGTMYIWDSGQDVMVTGTSGPNPPTVSVIPTPANAPLGSSYVGLLAFGSKAGGGAQYLITNFPADKNVTPNVPAGTSVFDLTSSPPSLGTPIIASGGSQGMALGPDGCVYMAQVNTIWRITDAKGACSYTGARPPILSLTPAVLASTVPQGSAQTLKATFNFVTVPDGTPVSLDVTGANPQILQATTTGGAASFTYTGAHQGVDTLIASATVGMSALTSNNSAITWSSGTDVTFLSLDQSPSGDTVGQTVTLASSLVDVSTDPISAVAGEQVNFSVGALNCQGTTDAKGNANCQVTPNNTGTDTLSANFAGTAQLNPSSDSRSFSVVAVPTPTPVPGKLRVKPKKLNFGSVAVNGSKVKTVKVTNLGKVINKKKKHFVPDPITIEMEDATSSTNPSPFSVTQCAPDDQLQPKSKGQPAGTCTVTVKFAPAAAGKFTGTLMIIDNVETTNPNTGSVQMVPMVGVGKAPKGASIAGAAPFQ